MTSFTRNTAPGIFNRFAQLWLFALLLLTAPPALADGSFLLQLGTFASRDEATAKWQEVKNGNSDIVAGLEGHVAEVMLPGDSTPTYRAQVGPVSSRHQAKALCKSLENHNVTCFVVETAFAASDLAPEMAGDVSTPAPAAPAEPAHYAPAPTLKATAPEEQISASNVEPIEVPAPAAVAPVVAAQPKDTMAAPVMAAVNDADEAPVRHQKTAVRVARKSNGNFNPNDMKKSGFFRGTFDIHDQQDTASDETAPAPKASAVTKTASASKDDDKPGFFGRLFGGSRDKEEVVAAAPAPTPAIVPVTAPIINPAPSNVKGNVEVAEAIRVPVTTNSPIDKTTNYIAVADTRSSDTQPEVAADGNNAYFVQVSYFKTDEKAQDFYSELRGNAPQAFTNVRIRMTHPRRSRVSLRMGAFTSIKDVQAVCAEAREQGLRCTSIRDTGVDNYAAVAAPVSKRHLSPLETVEIPGYQQPANSVYETSATSASPASATAAYMPSSIAGTAGMASQWVSLGGFATAQSAWNHWKSLQGTLPELRDVKTSITGVLGAKEGEKYQLRAGPIVTDVDAENICKLIVNTGNSCSVSEGQ